MKPKKYIRSVSNRPRRTLEKQLDGLWQKHIQERAGGKCEKCGSEWRLSGHHAIKRRYTWHRHAPLNGTCLCEVCHEWAERFPGDFMAWLKGYDSERYEHYMEHRMERSSGPVPISTMEAWRNAYKAAQKVNA